MDQKLFENAESALIALRRFLETETPLTDVGNFPPKLIEASLSVVHQLEYFLNQKDEIQNGLEHAKKLRVLNHVPLVEGTLEAELYELIRQGVRVTSADQNDRRNALSNLRRNGYIFNKGSKSRPEWIVVE